MAEKQTSLSLKRRLMSGGAWAFGGRILTLFTAFATNALLARLLPPQDLGAYFLAFSLVLVGSYVGALGLPQAAVRFLAESLALDNPRRIRQMLNTLLILGLLGALGTGFLYFAFGDVLSTSLFRTSVLTAVTGLVAGWITVMSLQHVLSETFRGFHDLRLASAFSGPVAGVLLTCCLLLIWLLEGHATLATAIGLAAGSVLLSVLLAGWALRRRVALLPSGRAESTLGAIETLRVALPMMIQNVAIFGVSQADLWIVGIFQPEEEVALYGAAARLALTLMIATQILQAVLPPLIVEKHATNERVVLEQLLRGGATLSSIVVLPLFLAFVLTPDLVLRLVYGGYYEGGRWILVILSAGIFTNVLTGIRGYVLMLTGNERIQLVISLIGGTTNIALCILGAVYWGIYGVALAAMTTMIFQCLAEMLVVRRRLRVWTHVSPNLAASVWVMARSWLLGP